MDANGVALHVREDGDAGGAPVVFANSLGTDMRLWDEVVPLLPEGLRILRFDMRGHGLSACPAGPYTMDDLTSDTLAMMDVLGLGRVTFVGLSIGGMVGQDLAATAPDRVRALVLSNTAARMGTPAMWQTRIEAIEAEGLPAMEDAILDRWFGPAFRHTDAARLWGAMLSRTPQAGYLGCCAAIAGADLTQGTAGLRCPTLAIAGRDDRANPLDVVANTAALIPNAEFHVIEGAGHLPCVEDPRAFADILTPFLKEHAYG